MKHQPDEKANIEVKLDVEHNTVWLTQAPKGLGRKLMEHLLAEASRMNVDCIHLTSNPQRVAANALYQKMGFEKKETNCYII